MLHRTPSGPRRPCEHRPVESTALDRAHALVEVGRWQDRLLLFPVLLLELLGTPIAPVVGEVVDRPGYVRRAQRGADVAVLVIGLPVVRRQPLQACVRALRLSGSYVITVTSAPSLLDHPTVHLGGEAPPTGSCASPGWRSTAMPMAPLVAPELGRRQQAPQAHRRTPRPRAMSATRTASEGGASTSTPSDVKASWPAAVPSRSSRKGARVAARYGDGGVPSRSRAISSATLGGGRHSAPVGSSSLRRTS